MILLQKIHIHPAYFFIPALLGILGAAFEGVGIGLLIPVLQGFLEGDYSFIKNIPFIGSFLSWLPWDIGMRDRSLFIFLISIFAFSIVLKNIFNYTSDVSVSYLALRALHHLRKSLFGRYLIFGKLYFDQASLGHHSAILTELARLAFLPLIKINKYMGSLFSLIAYMVVMMSISWKLTLFALPLFAILHWIVRMLAQRIQVFSQQITQRTGQLGKVIVEILSVMPLVRSSGTERKEQENFTQVSNAQATLEARMYALHMLVTPIQELITLFSALLLLAIMLYLMVLRGENSASSFIVYFYLVLNSAAKFGTLTGFRGELAKASGPVSEVWKVFEDEDKHFIADGTREFAGLQKNIEFRNLRFSYPGGKQVLRDISFTVPGGGIVAIVGPTGTGKTTIINLLMRYYDCLPGQIFLDGTDIRDFAVASLYAHIGLVSQDTLLLHDSLRHNITYGLENVTEEELQSAVLSARLQELVLSLPHGLDTMIGDRGVKLSGGEKQRVAIARALLKKADILLLDEATSALDSKTEKLVQEAIEDAIRNKTAIVIAHRLSTIKNANRIVVVEDGQCKEQGAFDELIASKGIFHEYWEQQKFT